MKLADGRGWIFETRAQRRVLCDRIEPIKSEVTDMVNAVYAYMKAEDTAQTQDATADASDISADTAESKLRQYQL